MTSHDREFMNRLVSKIAEIDSGEIIAYSGDYDFYERQRAIRENNQHAAFARQQAMLAKEQRFIDRFRTHAAKAAQVRSFPARHQPSEPVQPSEESLDPPASAATPQRAAVADAGISGGLWQSAAGAGRVPARTCCGAVTASNMSGAIYFSAS